MHPNLILFPHSSHLKPMKPLLFLSNAFINTFGITQPSPKAANRTAWFIAILLLAVLVTVVTVGVFVVHSIYRH